MRAALNARQQVTRMAAPALFTANLGCWLVLSVAAAGQRHVRKDA